MAIFNSYVSLPEGTPKSHFSMGLSILKQHKTTILGVPYQRKPPCRLCFLSCSYFGDGEKSRDVQGSPVLIKISLEKFDPVVVI